MTTAERSGDAADLGRGALAALALSGVLYWIGFRDRHKEAPKGPPLRSLPPTAARDMAPFAPVADRPHAWTDVLSHVWANIGRHRILAIAAGVTFYALLALFPAIAAIVTLYGLFADTAKIAALLDSLAGVLPGGAIEVVGDQVARIASGPPASLSVTFIVSLAISLWSANAGIKAIFDALNVVYNVDERRGFIRLNVVSLAFTLTAIVFLLAAMVGVVVVPIVLKSLPLGSSAAPLISYARWPLMLIGIGLALSFVYRFGPNRDKAQWRWITWGSALAALAWLAASLLFSWYAANFGSYNKTYGSLGAIIGFMTWMWLSTIVLLLGAEIDAVMERWDRGTAH
jgi:membrane protein